MAHRTLLVLGSSLATTLLLACTLACSGPSAKHSAIRYAPSENVGIVARCAKVCDVEARAPSLPELCDQIVERTKAGLALPPKCTPERPIGMWNDSETAVHDAALVHLTLAAPERRYTLLAISTDRGWELVREVAAFEDTTAKPSHAVQVTAARPVEVPELVRYGIEVKVRFETDAERERTFVCGVQAGGAVSCPVAVETL